MSTRAQKALRVLVVQRQLHRIEEWKHAELVRRLAELERAQEDLVHAFNEDDALQGLFLDVIARRLQSLGDAAALTRKDIEVQGALLLEHAARAVRAERLYTTLEKEETQAGDRAQLLEIIERYVGSATQASRKIAEG